MSKYPTVRIWNKERMHIWNQDIASIHSNDTAITTDGEIIDLNDSLTMLSVKIKETEYFEDDILKVSMCGEFVVFIRIIDGTCVLRYFNGDYWEDISANDDDLIILSHLGNIHENPEIYKQWTCPKCAIFVINESFTEYYTSLDNTEKRVFHRDFSKSTASQLICKNCNKIHTLIEV